MKTVEEMGNEIVDKALAYSSVPYPKMNEMKAAIADALRSARQSALEEAARWADQAERGDRIQRHTARSIAAGIRSLAEERQQ